MAKTVVEKLGYRPGVGAAIIGAPSALRPLFEAMTTVSRGPAPFILIFTPNAAAIEKHAETAAKRYIEGGHLWFAYPKKTGAIKTDIHRDVGWDPVHSLGLLGVTQIAIDDDWSALRFRRRAEIKTLTRKSERPGAA